MTFVVLNKFLKERVSLSLLGFRNFTYRASKAIKHIAPECPTFPAKSLRLSRNSRSGYYSALTIDRLARISRVFVVIAHETKPNFHLAGFSSGVVIFVRAVSHACTGSDGFANKTATAAQYPVRSTLSKGSSLIAGLSMRRRAYANGAYNEGNIRRVDNEK